MSAGLVSSIAAAAGSRLLTVQSDASLRDVAQLLSSTQISLVVVCDQEGAMIGVITKSDIGCRSVTAQAAPAPTLPTAS